MGSKKGVKKRPTTERDRLYRLVLGLREDGLSYNQIIERVEVETGVTLRKSHISGWINGKHRPLGYVRAFDASPCAELAYVIGVSLGDASTSSSPSNYNHKIKLRVIDEEFAQEFARCLGVLLGRTPPRVKWHEKTHSWHTELSSLLLMRFLRRDLVVLVPLIEHCPRCMGAFLRGFYDSEASIRGRQLRVHNGDLDKLKLVCRLLSSLGIETTGPHLRGEKGGTGSIKGKLYHVNKDQYYVYVRTSSLLAFSYSVGFTIVRKQERLKEAVMVRGRG